MKAKIKKPKTIADLKKGDGKMYEYYLRSKLKTGCTLKEFINAICK